MPVGNFNSGRDSSIVILHPLVPGGRLDLSIVTSFDVKPNPKMLKVMGLDGVERAGYLPGAYTGTITVDRANNAIDAFDALISTVYYAGGDVPKGTIYEYITEVGGSTSTYQLENVTLHVSDLGSKSGDQVIKQTIAFEAEKRKAV